tara:strand:- start:8007 stop:8156 length:150 start_codon:yes stop_codon:yes gene_type:complete
MHSLEVKNINIKTTTYLMFPQKLPTRSAYIVDKEDIFSLFPLPEDFLRM